MFSLFQRPPRGESRLSALLASLLFSVPTAALLWFGINRELSFFGQFLGSHYLLGSILVFALLALIFPRLFPSMLGYIWRLASGWFRWL